MELSLVSIVLIGFLFVSCDTLASKEVEALRRLKEAMYKDPLLVMSNWNVQDSDPCDWNGIKCSPSKNHIIKINISDTLMRGFLVPELGQITYLQELILRGNILMGTIPKEIGKLKKLKILDLGSNHLTGPIPAEIGSLSNIMIINLQSNGLTGELPPEVGNLKYLRELLIERNRLQGTITVHTTLKQYGSNPSASISGLCKSRHLKVADFSYNFFQGKIPTCLDYLPRKRFQGNCMNIKDVKQRPSSECAAFVAKKKKKKHIHMWLLDFEIVTGSSVGLILRDISSDDHGDICVLPNALEHRNQNLKGNSYSFGLLLLEIVSGRPSYCQERGCLVKWAKEYVGGPKVLVDPELEHFNQTELEAVCEAASQCLNLDQNDEETCCLVKELCETLESRIVVSISAELRSSSLAWAELALASPSNEDKYERSK